MRDLTEYETFPFDGQLTVRPLEPPVAHEPPRDGEGGVDCTVCGRADDQFIWSDPTWRLSLYEPSPFRGVVLLSPREHYSTIGELSEELAAALGPMIGRIERAIDALGGIGRVHVNVWGDGGAHLHIWFYPRPHGQLQLRGTFLPVWGLVLDPLPESELRAAGAAIAAHLDAD